MNSKSQEILDSLKKDVNYTNERKFLVELIGKYKTVPREKTYELHSILTSHAIEKNWGRRKLDVMIDEIVHEIKHNNEYSSDLYDLLTNYLDGLEGNVASEAIIRLNNDPLDTTELRGYVRSGKWWDEDFYSK